MTYGYCVYHKIECDYKSNCIDCPHNTKEDVEWFKQDEELAKSEGSEITKEEAIRAFEDMKKGIFPFDCREFCNIAIEALKNQKPCDNCIFKNEWEKIFSLIEERLLGDKE